MKSFITAGKIVAGIVFSIVTIPILVLVVGLPVDTALRAIVVVMAASLLRDIAQMAVDQAIQRRTLRKRRERQREKLRRLGLLQPYL